LPASARSVLDAAGHGLVFAGAELRHFRRGVGGLHLQREHSARAVLDLQQIPVFILALEHRRPALRLWIAQVRDRGFLVPDNGLSRQHGIRELPLQVDHDPVGHVRVARPVRVADDIGPGLVDADDAVADDFGAAPAHHRFHVHLLILRRGRQPEAE
jgi:hypothetical protein